MSQQEISIYKDVRFWLIAVSLVLLIVITVMTFPG